MTVIREDSQGLFARVGGYIVRPDPDRMPTEFVKGDKTEGYHFGGSQDVGMGKIEGRQKYKEYWKTHGSAHEYSKG